MKEWITVSNALILTEAGTNKQYNLLKLCFYAGNQAMLRLLKEVSEGTMSQVAFNCEMNHLQTEIRDFAALCQEVNDIAPHAIETIIKQ
jgi:hypothetical protein